MFATAPVDRLVPHDAVEASWKRPGPGGELLRHFDGVPSRPASRSRAGDGSATAIGAAVSRGCAIGLGGGSRGPWKVVLLARSSSQVATAHCMDSESARSSAALLLSGGSKT